MSLAFACFLHVRCETSLSVDSQRHAAVILNHHSVKKTNPGFMDHVYLFHKSLHTGKDTAVLIHLYSQDIVSFFFLNFHREPH